MRNGQNCAQSFQVHILCSNIMMHRHDESPGVVQGARDRPLRNSEQGILSLRRPRVYQVQDLALWLAHDGGMRRGYEITHAGRVTLVAVSYDALGAWPSSLNGVPGAVARSFVRAVLSVPFSLLALVCFQPCIIGRDLRRFRLETGPSAVTASQRSPYHVIPEREDGHDHDQRWHHHFL